MIGVKQKCPKSTKCLRTFFLKSLLYKNKKLASHHLRVELFLNKLLHIRWQWNRNF